MGRLLARAIGPFANEFYDAHGVLVQKKMFSARYRTQSLLITTISAAILSGCAGPEATAIGTWKNQENGESISVRPDHILSAGTGPKELEGSWTLVGNTFNFTPTSLGGKTPQAIKQEVAAAARIHPGPPKDQAVIGTILKSLDGTTLTVSEDRRHMKGEFLGQSWDLVKID